MTTPMISNSPDVCGYCGASHPNMTCPRISAFEFWPDGQTIKRIEFFQDKPTDILDDHQPEPDADLRLRIMAACGSHSIHYENLKIATGKDLEDIGSYYGILRKNK